MESPKPSDYQSPLSSRYSSREMSRLFSDQFKYSTWRRLWIALAKGERAQGLPITDAQIAEMEQHVDEIDFAQVAVYEKKLQHDVMAHIHTYGDLCPSARPIIHLGATSCYVTDNTDVIQMQHGLDILLKKLKIITGQLAEFCRQHADLACLALTHFQPAQPTTVGKRAALWLQDFLEDAAEISSRRNALRFLGVKGTTGTQASFLQLFDNDSAKVTALEECVCNEMGFEKTYRVTGQTYPRKQDSFVLGSLAQFGASAHKFSTDLRLLAGMKELEEPFGQDQVGSSAMPYKRNPMLSERISSLSRYLMNIAQNPLQTASLQWLERTLDDSANRRLAIAEAFLCADALMELLIRVTQGIVVNRGMIKKRLYEELPFMVTEMILMAAASKGGDRQTLHEAIRKKSIETAREIKEEGKPNTLLKKIADDPLFAMSLEEIQQLIDKSQLTGRAGEQVREFLEEVL